MNKVIFLLVLAWASFSQAATLIVENNSDQVVTIGTYKGIYLPSICESTGYSFCWEEAFVEYKPLSSEYKNFKGEVTVDLSKYDKTIWIEIDGSQLEVHDSCAPFSEETLVWLDQLGPEVKRSQISSASTCLLTESTKIIID